MRVERHSEVVEDDLPDIYERTASDDPAAAERVLNAVEETFEQIAVAPNIGVLYVTRNPRAVPKR